MPANAWYWVRLCIFVIHLNVTYSLMQRLDPVWKWGKQSEFGLDFIQTGGKALIKGRGGGVGGGGEMVIRN